MNHRIPDWIRRIDQVTEAFQAQFGSLSQAQLNRKPDAGTWSVAQNIDHLITVNTSYFPVLEELHLGTYQPPIWARLSFLTAFFGRLVLGSVQPDRRRKIKTVGIWEPAESHIPEGILDRFGRHQEELKAHIREAEDLLAEGVVIASPASRTIVYPLATAFEIVITHEERHLAQAKEVRDRLGLDDASG